MNMYKSARRFTVLKRILEDGVLLSPKKVSGLNTIRSYAGPGQEEIKKHDQISFITLLKKRRHQASKSILVEVENQNSCLYLYDYLSEYGKIQKMYHYTTKENLHFALVEMGNKDQVSTIINDAEPTFIGALPSNFFWFKTPKINKKDINDEKYKDVITSASTQVVKDDSKIDFFNDVSSLGLKMVELYTKLRIDDFGFRLRFLTCNQMEKALFSINSSISVLPFGSSINGFGRKGGDLDMVAIPKADGKKLPKESARLVFHGKKFESQRTMEQTHLFLISDIAKHILPGCVEVNPVVSARVPILKYYQKQTLLECDLSLYRRESVIMSEILYFLSSVDSRVRPLVFFIRHWAKEMTLTNHDPGKWVTNFQLTLLVIFFLQRSENFLIPLEFMKLDRNVLLTEEDFLKKVSKHQNRASKNKQSLEELLLKFFQFYANFDFTLYGMSLTKGELVKKYQSHRKSLLIENPLSPELNVAKNVSSGEVDRIQDYCARAASTLREKLQGSELDHLSYLKISGLVKPDHNFDGSKAVDNLDRDKIEIGESAESLPKKLNRVSLKNLEFEEDVEKNVNKQSNVEKINFRNLMND